MELAKVFTSTAPRSVSLAGRPGRPSRRTGSISGTSCCARRTRWCSTSPRVPGRTRGSRVAITTGSPPRRPRRWPRCSTCWTCRAARPARRSSGSSSGRCTSSSAGSAPGAGPGRRALDPSGEQARPLRSNRHTRRVLRNVLRCFSTDAPKTRFARSLPRERGSAPRSTRWTGYVATRLWVLGVERRYEPGALEPDGLRGEAGGHRASAALEPDGVPRGARCERRRAGGGSAGSTGAHRGGAGDAKGPQAAARALARHVGLGGPAAARVRGGRARVPALSRPAHAARSGGAPARYDTDPRPGGNSTTGGGRDASNVTVRPGEPSGSCRRPRALGDGSAADRRVGALVAPRPARRHPVESLARDRPPHHVQILDRRIGPRSASPRGA